MYATLEEHEAAVSAVIAAYPVEWEEVCRTERQRKDKIVNFFMGKVMKLDSKLNPNSVKVSIIEQLNELEV